ncbi:MAG: ribokinase [Ktedonobacteraceae bacterium]|nr:ribokinase [Ktedonobacteraceae bacterium]
MGIVVVLGSLITDLVARAPRFPHPGESLIGNDFGTFLGGKGINQAVAAARLGAQVALVGRVGMDTFGDAFFPVLAHENVDSSCVERDTSIGTGVSVVIISEENGQNAIVVSPNANLAVPGPTVERALRDALDRKQKPEEAAIFLTQCETSSISYQTGLRRARDLGMTTILNAAPIPREPLPDELFALVDILVVNEVEAAALSGQPVTTTQSARTAAEQLLARGPRHVIITLGEQGGLWSTGAPTSPQHRNLPAIKIQAVDATAAGDAFCGALAASLSQGQPLEAALQRASAAGALTVTRQGAIAALPTAQEVEQLLAK